MTPRKIGRRLPTGACRIWMNPDLDMTPRKIARDGRGLRSYEVSCTRSPDGNLGPGRGQILVEENCTSVSDQFLLTTDVFQLEFGCFSLGETAAECSGYSGVLPGFIHLDATLTIYSVLL